MDPCELLDSSCKRKVRGRRWNGTASAPGLNAVYGPNGSGKTSVADFLGHVLFGKRPTSFASVVCGGVPQGEATVDSGSSLYRLRRYHEGTAGTRLTVAGIDGSSVDEGTIRNLGRRLVANGAGATLRREFRRCATGCRVC